MVKEEMSQEMSTVDLCIRCFLVHKLKINSADVMYFNVALSCILIKVS